MADGDVRQYEAEARSTDAFGRVLCKARDHHFVIDGPVWNGCPGEALTPGEAFMAAIAACGVELVEVMAREDEVEVGPIEVSVRGAVDRDHPVREDVTVFNHVRMRFDVGGVTEGEAGALIERVQARCPLYGSVAASVPDLEVEVRVH
jgi:uncharacterized OsmC-like protein